MAALPRPELVALQPVCWNPPDYHWNPPQLELGTTAAPNRDHQVDVYCLSNSDSEPDPDSSPGLWRFLLQLLKSEKHTNAISWSGKSGKANREFKLHDVDELARLWRRGKKFQDGKFCRSTADEAGRGKGKRERKRPYGKHGESLLRTLCFYCKKNVLRRVKHKRMVWAFVAEATNTRKRAAETVDALNGAETDQQAQKPPAAFAPQLQQVPPPPFLVYSAQQQQPPSPPLFHQQYAQYPVHSTANENGNFHQEQLYYFPHPLVHNPPNWAHHPPLLPQMLPQHSAEQANNTAESGQQGDCSDSNLLLRRGRPKPILLPTQVEPSGPANCVNSIVIRSLHTVSGSLSLISSRQLVNVNLDSEWLQCLLHS